MGGYGGAGGGGAEEGVGTTVSGREPPSDMAPSCIKLNFIESHETWVLADWRWFQGRVLSLLQFTATFT